MLTQRLDVLGKEKIETMDRLAIIEKKVLNQLLDFPKKEEIETMDRLAVIQGQNIVQATVGIFRKRKD